MQKTNTQKNTFSRLQLPISSFYTTGFTLVELIVTVSIFALISTIVLVRNSQFDNEVLLSGVAYDVALSVRQAQNYGINVLGKDNEFDHPYGVYFESSGEVGVTSYVLFRDADGDYAYDAPDEALDTYTLGRGFSIGRVCNLTNDEVCTAGNTLPSATILFLRPDPDAIINASEKGEDALGGVGVELITPRGGSRFVVVESTGQISISKLDVVDEGDGTGVVGI